MQQPAGNPGENARTDSGPDRSGLGRGGERRQRAGEQRTLGAEVDDPGPLADELPERGEKDDRAGVDATDQCLLNTTAHASLLVRKVPVTSGPRTMRARSTSTTFPSRFWLTCRPFPVNAMALKTTAAAMTFSGLCLAR